MRHWWAPFPCEEAGSLCLSSSCLSPFLLPSLTLAAQDSVWGGACALYNESPFPPVILLVFSALLGGRQLRKALSAFLASPLHNRPGLVK